MDKIPENCNTADLPSVEMRVKPKKYPKQEAQRFIAFQEPENLRVESKIMEAICSRENLIKALKRVLKNKGAAGIDGMTIDQLTPYVKKHWPKIKVQLLEGTFKMQPARQVAIPKAGGKGTRKLGIPTLLDRFISQAILQILQTYFDPKFSEHSYGFRPRKSAHQAISQAQKYAAEGYRVVVDIDLENFFDKVNHDKLMSEIAKRVPDKRLLKLLRQFLKVGMLSNGLVKTSDKETCAGKPVISITI